MDDIESQIGISKTDFKHVGRPTLFLDRDGVVVEEVEYLRHPEDVRIARGAAELIGYANGAGIPVVVVTNQAGISRGLYSWTEYQAVKMRIDTLLRESNCAIDLTLACPFHPEFTRGYNNDHAAWRKPGPRMIQKAASILNVNMERSILIGDNVSDIQAAKDAPLPIAIHLLTGHGQKYRTQVSALAAPNFKVILCDDLTSTLHVIADHIS